MSLSVWAVSVQDKKAIMESRGEVLRNREYKAERMNALDVTPCDCVDNRGVAMSAVWEYFNISDEPEEFPC